MWAAATGQQEASPHVHLLTFPSTPTPQSDSWIMLTSLPPSPAGHRDQRDKPGNWGEAGNTTPTFHAFFEESYVFCLPLSASRNLSAQPRPITPTVQELGSYFTGRGAEYQRDQLTGWGSRPRNGGRGTMSAPVFTATTCLPLRHELWIILSNDHPALIGIYYQCGEYFLNATPFHPYEHHLRKPLLWSHLPMSTLRLRQVKEGPSW